MWGHPVGVRGLRRRICTTPVTSIMTACDGFSLAGLMSLLGSHPATQPSSSPGLAAAIHSSLRQRGVELSSVFNPYDDPAHQHLDKPNPQVVTQALGGCTSLIMDTDPPPSSAAKREILDFVGCLRSHGLPLSDPKFYRGGLGSGVGPRVNPNPPRFESARAECSRQAPGLLGPPT